jgi:hypothetical protein
VKGYNFKAWRKGNGILFPNLRAWFAGEISFRNLMSQFLPKIISPVEEERVVTRIVPSTYATLYKKLPSNGIQNQENGLVFAEEKPPMVADSAPEMKSEPEVSVARISRSTSAARY